MSRRTRAGLLLSLLLTSGLAAAVAHAQAPQHPLSPWVRHGGSAQLVTLTHDGLTGEGGSLDPSISSSGRFVVFSSQAENLVPRDRNGYQDVFLRDLETNRLERVSVGSGEEEPNDSSFQPAVSGDGRHVVFISGADNLLPDGQTSLFPQLFIRDRVEGTTRLVSRGPDGKVGTASVFIPQISADGGFVVFTSSSGNLVPGDTNDRNDVFVYDVSADKLELVTRGPDGSVGDASSGAGYVAPGGRYVTFASNATNIVPGDSNALWDHFLLDRETGERELISVASDGTQGDRVSAQSTPATVTADGRYVAFLSQATNLVPYDTNLNSQGRYGWDVFVRDRTTGVTERASLTSSGGEFTYASGAKISEDGRHVLFWAPVGADPDADKVVWLRDRQMLTTEMVSRSSNGEAPNGESENADMTRDAGRVVFHSLANNLAPGDANPKEDVYVYDRAGDLSIPAMSSRYVRDHYEVRGTGSFGGVPMADVPDSGSDSLAVDGAGEITSVKAVYRVELADVLFRIGVADIPPANEGNTPGTPTSYTVSWRVEDLPWQAAALPAGADVAGVSRTIAHQFQLSQCGDFNCSRILGINGGYGTLGDEIQLAVPIANLALEDDELLEDIEVTAHYGTDHTRVKAAVDTVSVPAIDLPLARFELAVEPADTPAEQAAFNPTGGSVGLFLASVPISEQEGPNTDALVRTCMGDACGSPRRVRLETSSDPEPTATPTATPTAEPTATPTVEPTATATPTATPTAEPPREVVRYVPVPSPDSQPSSAVQPATCGQSGVICGTSGDDRIVGTPGDDVILAFAGDDVIDGGGGDDVILAGPGDDRVDAGPGRDSVRGGPGADAIFGGAGTDRLRGDDGPDRLVGGRGRDRLWGGPGRDTLDGRIGRDLCWGGPQSDLLRGCR